MPGSWLQNLQDNLNIDNQLIHNFAHLLYPNVNRSCLGHPLCDLSQDSPQDYILQSDLSWDQITPRMSTTRSIP